MSAQRRGVCHQPMSKLSKETTRYKPRKPSSRVGLGEGMKVAWRDLRGRHNYLNESDNVCYEQGVGIRCCLSPYGYDSGDDGNVWRLEEPKM